MRIHRITFTALILAVFVVSCGIAAMHIGRASYPDNTVSLHSGYCADGTLGGLPARAIQISLERTDQGWTGWMVLDPNQQNHSEFGQLTETTLMAGERIDINLSAFGEEEGTGRVCYQVTQDRVERKMFLVFPRQAGGTFRLVIRGSGNTGTNVVFMEEERSNQFSANASSTAAPGNE